MRMPNSKAIAAVVLPVPETASKKVMEKAPNSVATQIT